MSGRRQRSTGTASAGRLSYLVVHSVLHLLGYDHLDEGPQKKKMRGREEAILALLNAGRDD
jgi:probable rRNA maturation factor